MTPSTLYVIRIFLVLEMVKSKGTSGYVEQWPGMWNNPFLDMAIPGHTPETKPYVAGGAH
jgi:hypothetical protein